MVMCEHQGYLTGDVEMEHKEQKGLVAQSTLANSTIPAVELSERDNEDFVFRLVARSTIKIFFT